MRNPVVTPRLPDAWAGRYDDLHPLGSGGYGYAFLARRVSDDAPVVIKALREDPPTRAVDPGVHRSRALAQFAQEATILRLLMERGVAAPALYESNESCLVMDYVDGVTLRDLAYTKLSHQDVIQIGLRVCQALDQMHTGNDPIIFCDLSPDNIMVQPGGGFLLIDYGLARSARHGIPVHLRGLGTPCFAAPELYTVVTKDADVSTKTDVYSLGAILYMLLTEQAVPPRTVSLSNQRAALLREQVPRTLTSLILQMLQSKAGNRPNVSEVQTTLQTLTAELVA